jgi:hypothetical protein
MLYGRKPKFPGDLVFQPEIPIFDFSAESYAERQRQQFKVIYEKMKKQRDVNIDRFKFNYDRRVRGGEFEVNDFVWVLNSQRKVGLSPKLTPKYVGPYLVIEKLQNLIYKVKRVDGRKGILVHRNRLKRCFMRQDNIQIAKPEKKDATSQTVDLNENIADQQNDQNLTEILGNSFQDENEVEQNGKDSDRPISTNRDTYSTKRKRGRPPKHSVIHKKIVKLIGIAKRRRGRPPKRTRTNISPNQRIVRNNNKTQSEVRSQPARSCKKKQ